MKSVVIIGAGAAGLTAAIFAARAGASVTVLDSRVKPGAKIRISGGGRCNVLPSQLAITDFHTEGSVNAMRNILFSWPLEHVHKFFEHELRVPLKTEATGKVFPISDQSRDVVAALLRGLRDCGATLRTPFRVKSIEPVDGGFYITSANREQIECDRVVLASGGLSLPKSGSDGGGLAMARRLGHKLVPTYPALVPLLTRQRGWASMSGLSVPARITVERAGKVLDTLSGELLITHRGFSGPVILDVSRYYASDPDTVLRVNWGEVEDWDALLREGGRASVSSTLRPHLPNRLAEYLVARADVQGAAKLSELKRDARVALVDMLMRYPLPVSGDEGYKTAEVTGGGVPLGEMVTATLESRVVPGLHMCGEIIDVTGRLGGYNFLWAWVSGRKAGLAQASD